MLGATQALSLGIRAARRQARLVVPLALAELCVALVGWTPRLFVGAKVLAAARQVPAPQPQLALALGGLAALLDPSTWTIAALALLLSAAGAFLVRTAAFAGVLPSVSNQLGREAPGEGPSFSESLLVHPERWLVTRALASLLWLVALASVGGALVLGTANLTAHPGVGAALAMTVATFALLSLPFVDAALSVGFARSVLLGESPAFALAGGLGLAWRRAGALLPAWLAYLLVDGAIFVALAGADATIDAAPQDHARWVLLLVPRALVLVGAAVANGAVGLARLGTYAALVREEAGTLPSAPETIYEAVAITPVGSEPV